MAGRMKGFIFSVLMSLAFNLRWTAPAWVFLALHFWLDISIWWFVGSIGLWILIISLRVLIFGSLTDLGNYEEPVTENKNPYSSKYDPKEK